MPATLSRLLPFLPWPSSRTGKSSSAESLANSPARHTLFSADLTGMGRPIRRLFPWPMGRSTALLCSPTTGFWWEAILKKPDHHTAGVNKVLSSCLHGAQVSARIHVPDIVDIKKGAAVDLAS